MKKSLFACITIALVLAGCSSSYKLSTSTRTDLARSIRYVPTLANLTVQPQRVTATCTAAELESLKGDQARQTVVARALATVNADVLIAPRFTTQKGEDGKMQSMTVVGYAATFDSFRPMTEEDAPFLAHKDVKQNKVTSQMATNTLTVAEIEYGAKQTLALAPEELVGLDEAKALKAAKEKLLRQEKADFLYETHYTTAVQTGFLKTSVGTFSITAFPAKYVNYRAAKKGEVESLNLSPKPVVYYNLTADVVPVAGRIQLKTPNTDANAKEADLKEALRAAVLQKYDADFLLNEYFYVDRKDKVITRVTICGTPAVYANFRPLQEGDVIDFRLVGPNGKEGSDEPKSIWESLFGVFKKKN